jgi:uroporphyrinogen decarboxylase
LPSSSRERALKALLLEEPDRVPMFELEFQYPEAVVGEPYIMTGNGEGWERVVFGEKYGQMVRSGRGIDVTEHNVSVLARTCSKLGYDIIRPVFVPDHLRAIRIARAIAPDLLVMGSTGGTMGVPDGGSMAEVVKRVYREFDAVASEMRLRVGQSIEGIRAQVDAGADVLVDCTDFCLKEGPFFKPSVYGELIFPHLRMMVDAAHKKGAHFVMHTDGNLWPILDDLIRTGIDALHSIDPSAGMRIMDVKGIYGDKIALCGNVDAAALLAYGSEGDVIREARRCIDEGAPGGGYFLTSSNCIYRAVPVANALALAKTGREYGRYRHPS